MPPAGVEEEESGRRTYFSDRSWQESMFSPKNTVDEAQNGEHEGRDSREKKH